MQFAEQTSSGERRVRLGWPLTGALAVLFGVATLASGGSVLFGHGAADAGPIVLPVVWFNFLAGFAYVAAGVGVALRRRWAAYLAVGIAVATAVAFVAFIAWVATGGAHAHRTVGAMVLRTGFWSIVAWRARASLLGTAGGAR